MSRKTKVLVCGTTFGQVYLGGIQQASSDYELVGILSTGSEQSRQCSERYGVPLYTDIDQIDTSNIDIACVVVRSSIVGGKGTAIARQFLEKGVHVMQEQPVHLDDMMTCLKVARENRCLYMINTFYPYIETVHQFIQNAQKIKQSSKLVYIEATCSVQVMYPLLDMLNQSIDGLSPWSINKTDLKNGIFTIMTGKIKDIPYDIKIQNQLDANNPDNFFHLFHKIDFYYEGGRLSLSDTHQHSIWYPRVFVPNDEQGNLNLYTDNTFLRLPVSEQSNADAQEISYQNIYEQLWPKATTVALRQCENYINKPKESKKYLQQLLTLCQFWNQIGNQMGPVETIEGPKIIPLTLGGINK